MPDINDMWDDDEEFERFMQPSQAMCDDIEKEAREPFDYVAALKKAASRARGCRLAGLYAICEGQKTVSTKKLRCLIDELAESDRCDAIHLRQLADQMNTNETS